MPAGGAGSSVKLPFSQIPLPTLVAKASCPLSLGAKKLKMIALGTVTGVNTKADDEAGCWAFIKDTLTSGKKSETLRKSESKHLANFMAVLLLDLSRA